MAIFRNFNYYWINDAWGVAFRANQFRNEPRNGNETNEKEVNAEMGFICSGRGYTLTSLAVKRFEI